MKKESKKIRTRLKIVGATATAVFSLFSVFTATLAWFSSSNSTTVSGASITVEAMRGIQFDFYYLDYFGVKNTSSYKDGNFDSVIQKFAGYERAANNPVFTEVVYDVNGSVSNDTEHGSNPTSIKYLWPAHRLTYAIVVRSGTFNNFVLDGWGETRIPTVLTQVNDEDVEVSLSWAINIYSRAYYVTNQNDDIPTTIAYGFNSFATDNTLTDKFPYSQNLNITTSQKPVLPITDSNAISGEDDGNKLLILYFSIEFSDDVSTHYTKGETYYELDPVSGDSNCYENLSLTGLSFKIS